MERAKTLIVDRTHLGRRASGIERITEELFSAAALDPLPVVGKTAKGGGRLSIAVSQMLAIPAAMAARPASLWAFSGFPPSPLATVFRERCILYVHDLFLLTRQQDLNAAAKLYMAYPFRLAVERLRYFLVNSDTTGQCLSDYVRPDAEILPYRPRVRNVFGLSPRRDPAGDAPTAPLVLGAIGTVEPRKNFPAAAAIALELGRALGRQVELHIIGRSGWGEDHAALSRLPHVTLHGFLSDEDARAAIGAFDLFICTSHDEGLGLPLIEAQYAGLQVIAPEQRVFREVLGASGLFIDPVDAAGAAARIGAALSSPDWRTRSQTAAATNIARWNALADTDRDNVIRFLSRRLAALN